MPRYRRVQRITHQIGDGGSLTLSVASADVRLAATEGPQAALHATFEVDARNEAEADAIFESGKLQVEASEGRLSASEQGAMRRGLGAALNQLFAGREVELEEIEGTAPAGCVLDVQAVSGDVQATGFRNGQHYQTVSGDLRIADGGGDLHIESVSGDVSLRAARPVSLKVTSVSGDLSAEAPSYRQLRANTVSGDVSVDGALDRAGLHSVDTVSGDFRLASSSGMTVAVRGLASDIHSSLPHRLETSADRRRLIVGDGAATVTFNSMSGDMAVTRSRQQPAEIEEAEAPTETATSKTEDRLEILAALERGEINVDEAMRRLGTVR